jgi:hypothetical protein
MSYSRDHGSIKELFKSSYTAGLLMITLSALTPFFVVFILLWITLSGGYTELMQWPDLVIFVSIPVCVFWLLGRKSKWDWEPLEGRFIVLLGVIAGMGWGYYALEKDCSEKDFLYCGYLINQNKNCIVIVKKQGSRYYIDDLLTEKPNSNGQSIVSHALIDHEAIESHEFDVNRFGCIAFKHVRFQKENGISSLNSADEPMPTCTVYLTSKVEELKEYTLSDRGKAAIRAHLQGDCPDAIAQMRNYYDQQPNIKRGGLISDILPNL